MKKKLPLSFYRHHDVLEISQKLLGKYLFSRIDGSLTGGIITETEAYRGPEDRASHAYGMRRTKRNEVMYQAGGCVYVYLCYGLHYLFNVITNQQDIPHAILIRAIEPVVGIEKMLERLHKKKAVSNMIKGPGLVSKALGITKKENGVYLNASNIWIEDRGIQIDPGDVMASPRVGIDYAGEDALLPWRFRLSRSIIQPAFYPNL